MLQVLQKSLILRPHHTTKSSLDRSDHLVHPVGIISIHDIELQWLMFLEVIADDEAFLEIWVEIIFDLFGPPQELPVGCFGIRFVIYEADGV